MKSYDLRCSTDDMVEFDGPGGEFVLAVEMEERLATIAKLETRVRELEQPQPTYTDDVIAVMRATIAAQRATLAKVAEAIRYDVESGQDYVDWEFGDLERLAGEVHQALRHHEKRDGSPLPEGM